LEFSRNLKIYMSKSSGQLESNEGSVPDAGIAGGPERVLTPGDHFRRYSAQIAGVICIISFGIAAISARSQTRGEIIPETIPYATYVHGVNALAGAALHPVFLQDAAQTAPPPAAPSAPKPVEMPDGEGKPVAMEFCQDCHRLTNLTKAHKDLDDWKDTIHTMIDRGARIPDEKIDTLAQYLFTNFGPKDSAAVNAAAAAPSATAPAPDAATPNTPPPAKAVVVELPEGDGKAIATENCQACHKLTNLTKAHKDLDDWKDTVQTMIDRGANVPPDKVDILVQYLAKNFGPKDASAPAPAAPASSAPAQ
jgi:cytochrome c5